eukprot:TRINITY_DN8426_c0_g1_i1.p1 TRINITY_DN8426_c0_g1~~TRINITY_DN8426_c0_g1_i1.p1  ORF type:complete len:106 (+),score=21.57 TRINITY_DN8426_c0_g1_i1:106-423(+)
MIANGDAASEDREKHKSEMEVKMAIIKERRARLTIKRKHMTRLEIIRKWPQVHPQLTPYYKEFTEEILLIFTTYNVPKDLKYLLVKTTFTAQPHEWLQIKYCISE